MTASVATAMDSLIRLILEIPGSKILTLAYIGVKFLVGLWKRANQFSM